MKWEKFLNIAVPRPVREREAKKDLYFRTRRKLGIWTAYVFYHLGLTANFIDLLRILIVIWALYWFSFLKNGQVMLPLIAIVLFAFQDMLDAADGPVARVRQESTKLGLILDEIVNPIARGSILVLIAAFTNSMPMLIVGLFSLFILIHFIAGTGRDLPGGYFFKTLQGLYRLTLSIQFMLTIVPLLMVASVLILKTIMPLAYLVTSGYALLSSSWIILCLWKKNQ